MALTKHRNTINEQTSWWPVQQRSKKRGGFYVLTIVYVDTFALCSCWTDFISHVNLQVKDTNTEHVVQFWNKTKVCWRDGNVTLCATGGSSTALSPSLMLLRIIDIHKEQKHRQSQQSNCACVTFSRNHAAAGVHCRSTNYLCVSCKVAEDVTDLLSVGETSPGCTVMFPRLDQHFMWWMKACDFIWPEAKGRGQVRWSGYKIVLFS